ncbi:cupin domain-containing protein [Pelagibius sp.]|uniref:cupin domain-containing protein n=1 Tax=Pelagibius sp. TaxID=1931238 RepID=UPI0026334525|nr:cupin domain-containing protein [Pelagibius sp.]
MTLIVEDMQRRLVRYAELVPCTTAFVDTRTPGSDKKENFTIIGPGVSESPDQHVHIAEPHGFNIGGARQPGGCVNSQHSHDTAEVFVVHSGRWRLIFGPDGKDGHLDVAPGDVASVPIHMFRGFKKLDEDVGFLWVVLGGDDPGKVTWAPNVFDMAASYGLKLLKGGRLIDTAAGETLPEGAALEQPPSEAELKALATPPAEKLADCVLTSAQMRGEPNSPLAREGVEECPVITTAPTGDGFRPGPIVGWWPHGFALRCLKMRSGARVPRHIRDEEEVIFVHRGALTVGWDGSEVVVGAGDTLTVPKGLARAFQAGISGDTVAFVVRGGDAPGAPRFVEPDAPGAGASSVSSGAALRSAG